MEQHLEQRYAIKFCVRLNKTATETLGMLQEAFNEEFMSRAMIFMWHKRFKDGRGNIEDDDRSGRTSSIRTDQNVERVRELLNNDRRLSTRLIAVELGLSQSTVWRIVTENLMMRKVCAKSFVGGSEKRRMTVCQEMLQRLNVYPNLLEKVVTTGSTSTILSSRSIKAQNGTVLLLRSPRKLA
ncbi:protein GVQW3-like [Stegodyphus dumicola]|uniref:protein GVQW3-like n=1 Tax=Stegodyphus dumicola TaxID=202533 RepID=UPI0015AB8679|nr:protein GVQW3-like [Stegodyphus dumicola]